MKDTKAKRAIIVGIFIFLGLLIIVLTVFTLGSQQKTFQKSLTLKVMFEDVQGLQKGNNVWFSGVKIGTVKKISFAGSSQVEALINVDEKAKTYIRKNSLAKISSDGLIGSRIVVIYGGSDKFGEVEDGDMLGVEKSFSSDDMMNTLQKNNTNLLEITNDFKVVSKGLSAGNGTIGKLLTDETLINDMHVVMRSLMKTSKNVEKLSMTFGAYASKLNTEGSLAHELVTDTSLFSSLRASATEIKSITQTANALVYDLRNTSSELSNSLNNKNTPIGMLLKDEHAASDLKVTLKYLQSSSQKLDENLEALQHNFLLRGFFRRKARNEAKNVSQQK